MRLAFDPEVQCVFSLRKSKSNELAKLFANNVKMSAENSVSNAGYLTEEYVQKLAFNLTNSSFSLCQTGSAINHSIFVLKLELKISPFHCIWSFFLFCLVIVWNMAVSPANYTQTS